VDLGGSSLTNGDGCVAGNMLSRNRLNLVEEGATVTRPPVEKSFAASRTQGLMSQPPGGLRLDAVRSQRPLHDAPYPGYDLHGRGPHAAVEYHNLIGRPAGGILTARLFRRSLT
jgi:hypothetical protein